MKIFVGNLSDKTTEDDLRQAFEAFGEVKSVTLVTSTGEGQTRAFAFVTMPSAIKAQNAIEKMNGSQLKGQRISVDKCRTSTKSRSSRRKRSAAAGRTRKAASRKKKGRGGRRNKKRRR